MDASFLKPDSIRHVLCLCMLSCSEAWAELFVMFILAIS